MQATGPNRPLFDRVKFGVGILGIALHSGRHGGASLDRILPVRGSLRHSSSVQRYEKHAHLGPQIAAIRLAARPKVYPLTQQYDVDLEQLFELHFARLRLRESCDPSSSKSSRVLGTFPKL